MTGMSMFRCGSPLSVNKIIWKKHQRDEGKHKQMPPRHTCFSAAFLSSILALSSLARISLDLSDPTSSLWISTVHCTSTADAMTNPTQRLAIADKPSPPKNEFATVLISDNGVLEVAARH